MIRPPIRRSMFVLAVVGLLASSVAAPVVAKPPPGKGAPSDSAVLFASDGMRQDLVEKYAAQGLMPTMASFLKHGASATGDGLLTEAPPNTGAGWYSLATGAWPGVHGSTNNTFHINGSTFANSTSAFAPGVLKAESIAQSAERGGLKVAQVEWAGGANATIQGPTIDFQSFFSGRGVSTNFIGKAGDALFDDAAVHRGLRPPVRHARPATPAGPRSRPPRRPPRPAGAATCRRRSARPRRCGCASSTAAPTSTA